MAYPVLEALIVDYPDMGTGSFLGISRSRPRIRTPALAAEAAEAAARGRFWEMHDRLFTNQNRLDVRGSARLCRGDWPANGALDQEMKSHAYQDEVRRDFRRGIQDGVNGTPTIFLNGLRYDGPPRLSITPFRYRVLVSV